MNYEEKQMNLFDCPSDYHLVHCISADFVLGKGIAKEFNKRFDTRRYLRSHYEFYEYRYETDRCTPIVLPQNGTNVINLVTKHYYYNKPTYMSMFEALSSLKQFCLNHGIDKLAMPRIGCGLDKLSWDKVKILILKIFEDAEIDILVCVL